MTKFLFSLIALLLILVVLHGTLAIRFKSLAADLMDQVAGGPAPVLATRTLPAAIIGFTERAGVDQSQLARSVRLSQNAEMRLEKDGDWQPLSAEQIISTGTPGFVWLAEQTIGPMVKFRVIDAYVAGEGRLNVRALGSVPVANSMGPATDLAEAMRYLAELVWAPDAMLGNPALIWQEQPDGSVTVSLKLPHDTARVRFVFNTQGDITEVRARDRPAGANGAQIVLRDWLIRVEDYRDFGDRRVPVRGEVGYIYSDGYQAYWRGEITGYSVER